MLRFILASGLGLIAVAAASAGTVQIGGTTGLSSNYITQGAGAVCAAGAGNCVAGSTTGWGERNYDNILFVGATGASTTPTPFPGYQQTGGIPAGSTATDLHGNTFSMVSDGANGANNSNDYWQSTGTGGISQSIVIPIGLFSVTDVWTMIQNEWGTVGGNDTTVTFNFGATSNATSTTALVVALNDVNNNVSSPNGGVLRAALSCSTTSSATCNAATNPRTNPVQGTVVNGVTINEGVIYQNFNYDTVPSTQPFYLGTAGKLKLDDQQFVFNPATSIGQWLVSMTITENVANTFLSNPSAPSETALSAITVDTVVPEPGSVLLLLSGLAGVGFVRFRRS
jgi:hypothetical protein